MVKFNLIWHSKTYPYVCAQLRAKIILGEDDLQRVQECMQPPVNVWGDTQHDQQKWIHYCLKATFIKSYIFFIIVISLSPFSSWTPRNSSSFCCNAGLKVGTVITGLHLLHLQHHPPPQKKEKNSLTIRSGGWAAFRLWFKCLNCQLSLGSVAVWGLWSPWWADQYSLMLLFFTAAHFLQPAISWINGTELSPSEQMSWSFVVFVMSCELLTLST